MMNYKIATMENTSKANRQHNEDLQKEGRPVVGGREALPKEGLFELGRHCTLFAIPTYAHWPAQPFNKHCRQGPMQDRPKSPP